MFKRIELDAWLQILPQYALWIFIAVFIISVIRILKTSKQEVHYLESLPLNQEVPHYEK